MARQWDSFFGPLCRNWTMMVTKIRWRDRTVMSASLTQKKLKKTSRVLLNSMIKCISTQLLYQCSARCDVIFLQLGAFSLASFHAKWWWDTGHDCCMMAHWNCPIVPASFIMTLCQMMTTSTQLVLIFRITCLNSNQSSNTGNTDNSTVVSDWQYVSQYVSGIGIAMCEQVCTEASPPSLQIVGKVQLTAHSVGN